MFCRRPLRAQPVGGRAMAAVEHGGVGSASSALCSAKETTVVVKADVNAFLALRQASVALLYLAQL